MFGESGKWDLCQICKMKSIDVFIICNAEQLIVIKTAIGSMTGPIRTYL